MNSVEDEVRAATRAQAATLREVRPLRLAPAGHRAPLTRAVRARTWARHHLTTWLAPAGAAALVVALAISLVIIRDLPNGRVVPPASPASSARGSAGGPDGVPAYYIALPGSDDLSVPPGSTEAVVGNTVTGKPVATLRPEAGSKFFSVTATASDRTFILGEGKHAQPAVWYRARLTTGSEVHVVMTRLPIPAQPPNSLVVAAAVSPDGGKLAVLDVHSSSRTGEQMRVYSVSTGTLLRTWSSARNLGDYGSTTLSWTAGDRQLAIGSFVSMWTLSVTRPGHDLIADSRLAWSVTAASTLPDQPSPFSCAIDRTTLATADGKSVVCAGFGVLRAVTPAGGAACPAIPAWNTIGFLEYSASTGKLARTLDKRSTSCNFGGDGALWTDASGSTVLGYVSFAGTGNEAGTRFGVYRARSFTPLPAPPTIKIWGTAGIAW